MLKFYESGLGVMDLVSRVCDGDPEGVERFYCELLVPIAKAVLRSRRSNALEPEELANITFVHLCENSCRRLRTCTGENPVSWLWRVTYNNFLKKVQDSSPSLPLDDQPESTFSREDSTVNRVIVLDAIEHLSPRDGLVMRLRYLHGLDNQSIASQLGVPIGTLYVIASRAEKRLLTLLKGRAPDADAPGN